MENNNIVAIHSKLESVSYIHEGERCWNREQVEPFRQWLVKYLRRHPKARLEMINAPRGQNNRMHVLDHFTKHFCMNVPFRII